MPNNKLDAVFFQLYGVTDRDDVRYVYSTFPIVECEETAAYGGAGPRRSSVISTWERRRSAPLSSRLEGQSQPPSSMTTSSNSSPLRFRCVWPWRICCWPEDRLLTRWLLAEYRAPSPRYLADAHLAGWPALIAILAEAGR